MAGPATVPAVNVVVATPSVSVFVPTGLTLPRSVENSTRSPEIGLEYVSVIVAVTTALSSPSAARVSGSASRVDVTSEACPGWIVTSMLSWTAPEAAVTVATAARVPAVSVTVTSPFRFVTADESIVPRVVSNPTVTPTTGSASTSYTAAVIVEVVWPTTLIETGSAESTISAGAPIKMSTVVSPLKDHSGALPSMVVSPTVVPAVRVAVASPFTSVVTRSVPAQSAVIAVSARLEVKQSSTSGTGVPKASVAVARTSEVETPSGGSSAGSAKRSIQTGTGRRVTSTEAATSPHRACISSVAG